MSLYECVNSDPSANVDPFGLDCCGPDVTDWFVKELNIHSAFFRQHREAGHGLPFISYAKRIPYKWLIFKTENCPAGDKCKDTVTLAGHCIHKSDLGNIMFGAIGKQWLANERLLIWGGVRAAKRSKTGGIDSVEDMASSIAGLLVGDQLRELKADEALTVAAFSAAIASDPTNGFRVVAIPVPPYCSTLLPFGITESGDEDGGKEFE